ncbi:MAG: alpha-galactosidase [Clostridiales bacterium]|nr:alpha-galactosidase [Clostridiales bacterium]
MLESILKKEPVHCLIELDSEMADIPGDYELSFKDVQVFLKSSGEELSVYIQALSSKIKQISLIWDEPFAPGVRILCDHWERSYGDLFFGPINPSQALPWYFAASYGRRTECLGVKTGSGAICSWLLTGGSVCLTLDARNGGSGVDLNGRKLLAATVVALTGEDGCSAYSAIRKFCFKMCSNPLNPDKPIYGGNNWYFAYGRSSQQEMLEDGKFISSLARSENRPFMFVDDGWQICRNDQFVGGPWSSGNRNFPDMKRLAEDLKHEGARPGIWYRPLLNCEGLPNEWRLPPGRFLSRDEDDRWFLDPSRADVLEFIQDDIRRFRSWGYDMIKHDFSTYDIFGRWGFDMKNELTNPGWHFSDKTKTTAEIATNLYRCIKEAAEGAMILGCNAIGHLTAGYCQANRIGDDTSGVEWARTRKMGVNALAFRGVQHGAFFAADPDCVGLTEKIPWALNKQWLELASIAGTPLIVSVSAKNASKEQADTISRAFDSASRQQLPAEPLDWMDTFCPSVYSVNGEIKRYQWY